MAQCEHCVGINFCYLLTISLIYAIFAFETQQFFFSWSNEAMSCAIGRERHFFLIICINLQGVEDLRTKMDSECLHSSFMSLKRYCCASISVCADSTKNIRTFWLLRISFFLIRNFLTFKINFSWMFEKLFQLRWFSVAPRNLIKYNNKCCVNRNKEMRLEGNKGI